MNNLVMILATMLVLALSGAAQAATLFTPPLRPDTDDFLKCLIVNTTGVNRTVQIQVIGDDGVVLDDSGDVILAAGAIAESSVKETSGNHPRYCKFTVANKNFVRASACVFDNRCLGTVPAQ